MTHSEGTGWRETGRPTNEELDRRDALRRRGFRECGVCGQILTVASFTKNADISDGLSTKCADCLAARSRRWYADHRHKPMTARNAAAGTGGRF